MASLPIRVWPAAVERVAQYLRETAAEARVEEFLEGTPTAEAAAEAVGCELRQIVKSLVFECDGRPVLAMVPGDRRADAEKIARATGAQTARIAPPDRVQALTGFAPGAVAPFPLPAIDRILIDRSLLMQDVVWIGAGSPRHMAGLAPGELVRVSRATSLDLTRDD